MVFEHLPSSASELPPPPPTDPRCAAGLRRPINRKTIPVHMLYEDGGSAIYEEIERHPDYYPYETERGILAAHVDELIAAIPPGAVVLELGCGDCTKTSILATALARRDGRVDFVGIDASAECLREVQARLGGSAEVHFTAVHDNFFDGLALAARLYAGRDLCVLFLGSTLGNMSFADSRLFLRTMVEIASSAGGSPRILLGLDLWKDTGVLQRAYDNDVTARFELGGLRNALRSFDPSHVFVPQDWRYVVEVNPILNQVEMYAQAQRAHAVRDVTFAAGERVLLEVSHKFRPHELARLFEGCTVLRAFGEGYQVVMLAPDAPAEVNPWMRYGDADLYDIDRVACLDYAAFVQAYDWPEPDGRPITLLDVGCGSGALPTLLRASTGASRRFAAHIAGYDLLDISANSLRIAGGRIPFEVGRRYLTGIQDFSNSEHFPEVVATGYDVVWSIHGITAVRRADLWDSLANMLSAVRVGGRMVIVMSDHDSHYARVDRAWREDRLARGERVRERFLEAEDVVATLRAHGVPCEVVEIVTDHVFPAADVASWRNFNAWCVYDPGFDIARGGPAVQAYVRSCVDPVRDGYHLRLSSLAITVHRDALTTLRWRANRAAIPTLEGEAYARCCAAFEARSTQRAAIVGQLAASGVVGAGETVRVLSLGCGDGRQDLAMLAAAVPAGATVLYTGVDESEAQRARWAESVAAAGGRVGAARLEATGGAEVPKEARYDVVFLLHVLYYVDDLRQALEDARARLAPGGRLIVWHAPLEAMNELASVFWGPQRAAPIPFAREVEACLREMGATFTATRVDAALRVPAVGEADRDDVLSFLVQADVAALAADVRAELDAAVARLVRADGTMAHPVTCFVVA